MAGYLTLTNLSGMYGLRTSIEYLSLLSRRTLRAGFKCYRYAGLGVMLDISVILERLDQVRKSSNGYTACCPVHGDRNPSMSVTQKDDVILCHCFSCGANGVDVVAAIGLKPEVLFDKALVRDDDRHWLLNKKSDWDEGIIAMAHESIKRGESIRYSDYKVIKESLARREQRRKHNLPIMFNMDITL